MAVKSFVEAMYCGHLDITKENFRDVNKMCHVFNVTWMSGKCSQYFELYCKSTDPDLAFLFKEASYFCEHGGSGSLLEVWKNSAGTEKFNAFIGAYLKSRSDLPQIIPKTLMCLTGPIIIRYFLTLSGR